MRHGVTPPDLTPLVGRDDEIALVQRLIRDPSVRLLTLTGPAGVGKTRLAGAAVQQVGDRFANGIRFLDLTPLEVGEAREAVARLAGRDLVLVLDGCEHVVDGLAGLADLLAATPGLRVLATSRQPLRVYGEWLIPVSSLPPADAVALFVQRAQAVSPGFAHTPANAEALAEICARLDGLPLPIELAARRVQVFPPRALVAQVRRGLDVLAYGPVNPPARHRTMRAALAWSHHLLDAQEEDVLARLSVCEGGFDARTAEAVIQTPFSLADRLIESLVDKSLVVAREQPDGQARFSLLGVVSAFYREQLTRSGHAEETGRRHAEHFVAVARDAEPALTRRNQARTLDLLATEHDNVRAALRFLLDRAGGQRAASLAVALRRFWLVRGHLREGLRWLDEASAVGANDATTAEALDAAGLFAAALGDTAGATGRHDRALALCRSLGDRRGEALALGHVGMAEHLATNPADAARLLTTSLGVLQQLGDGHGMAEISRALAAVLAEAGRYEEAGTMLRSALTRYEESGDIRGIALTHADLAGLAASGGDLAEAQDRWLQSLSGLREVGERPSMPALLETVATALAGVSVAGRERQSARLLSAAQRLRADLGGREHGLAVREGRDLDPYDAALEAVAALPSRAAHNGPAPIAPLTPRQFEVAALVAQSMTNRQIARRLDIAEWTVVSHLRQVMRKLDCSSRVRVAQWVSHRQHDTAAHLPPSADLGPPPISPSGRGSCLLREAAPHG